MYNDTIKAENKIISNDALYQIFQMMGETLQKYKRISAMEEQKNMVLDYLYKEYSFRDDGSRFTAMVDFYDDTNIKFDNYENFISIFYSRLEEIKSINCYFSLSYSVKRVEPIKFSQSYSQSIVMYITEKNLDITLNLSSEDPKLDEIYQLIKSTILNAPPKYDDVIKEKNKITNTISLSSGLIPAIIISAILTIIPVIGTIFLKGFVVFPACSFLLAFFIGSILSSSKIDKYYSTIVPEKKYSGYSNGKSVYKDDVESFIGTSEILIGKKVNNLVNREFIKREYESAKTTLSRNLMILGIASVIVIIIGFFI